MATCESIQGFPQCCGMAVARRCHCTGKTIARLRQEQKASNDPAPTWTADPPTKPGWYWTRWTAPSGRRYRAIPDYWEIEDDGTGWWRNADDNDGTEHWPISIQYPPDGVCNHVEVEQRLSASENEKWRCKTCRAPVPSPEDV